MESIESVDELRRQVAEIRWWHRIDLGKGIVTPGSDNSLLKLKQIGMPEDLRGKTVIDIGAWDGFFSFEAERRGANRVVAMDSFVWENKGWASKAGFNLAKRVLRSNVEELEIDEMDLSPERVGVFDLVLFLGVLYHVRHPLLTLERVFRVTGDQLILETHVDLVKCPWPAMAFYPEAELDGDSTSWWGPNPQAVVAMLKTVGFRKVEAVSLPPPPSFLGLAHNTLLWWIQNRKIPKGALFPRSLQQGRLVVHAWR